MVRPEQPWSWPWELVGSSARAGRWKGAAWNMYRRIWGCSPWKELDQDGLSEEIDESALLLGKKQRRRNWSEEEVGRRSWRLGGLAMVAESRLGRPL